MDHDEPKPVESPPPVDFFGELLEHIRTRGYIPPEEGPSAEDTAKAEEALRPVWTTQDKKRRFIG